MITEDKKRDKNWLELPHRNDGLASVIEFIRNQYPYYIQRDVANIYEKLYPERIDFWLYRRILLDNTMGVLIRSKNKWAFLDKTPFYSVLIKLNTALHSEDTKIRTAATAIATRLQYEYIKFLFNTVEETKTEEWHTQKSKWIKLALRLINTKLYNDLCLSSCESRLLYILGRGTASDIFNVIQGNSRKYYDVSKLKNTFYGISNQLVKMSRIINDDSDDYYIYNNPITSINLLIDRIKIDRQASESAMRVVPWDTDSYIILLATSLKTISRSRKQIIINNLTAENYDAHRELYIRVRTYLRVAWSCYYIAHDKKKKMAKSKLSDGLDRYVARLNIQKGECLAELAFVNNALGFHINAAESATLSLWCMGEHVHKIKLPCLKRLKEISTGLACQIPHINTKGSNRSMPSTIHIGTRLDDFILINDPEIVELADKLDLPLDYKKLYFKLVDAAKTPETYTNPNRTLLFRLAIKIGQLSLAADISLSTRYKQSQLQVGADDLILYCNAVSHTFAKSLPLLYHRRHQFFRGMALRKLWKNAQEEIDINQTLMIHESHRGIFHSSLENTKSRNAILWKLRRDSHSAQELYEYYDHLSKYLPVGLGDYSVLERIDISQIVIPKDTTIVSIAVKDGHELSCVLIATSDDQETGSQKSLRENIYIEKIIASLEYDDLRPDDTTEPIEPKNWTDMASDIVKTQEIWGAHRLQNSTTIVPWGRSFKGLAKSIIEGIQEIKPSTKYISLSVPEGLRGLPWQHLFSVENNLEWLVYHALGLSEYLNLEPNDLKIANNQKKGFKTIVDNDDNVYRVIKDDIEMNRQSWNDFAPSSYLPSVMTVFTHGKRNGTFVKIFNDKGKLREKDLEDHTGYDLVLVHSCHAGFIDNAPFGDIGGLPGLFLSSGTKTVIAPIGINHTNTAKVFDLGIVRCITGQYSSFHSMFMEMIKKYPEISFYSVFGDIRKLEEKECDT